MSKRMLVVIGLCVLVVAAVAVAAELKVENAVICTGVKDRAPEGAAEKFAASVGKLTCFTKITGAAEGTVIKHVWFHGEEKLDAVELKVGADSWRTWSTKTIDPKLTGAWKVEVQDAEGKVLSTVNFTIE
jgi:hypothetical protein